MFSLITDSVYTVKNFRNNVIALQRLLILATPSPTSLIKIKEYSNFVSHSKLDKIPFASSFKNFIRFPPKMHLLSLKQNIMITSNWQMVLITARGLLLYILIDYWFAGESQHQQLFVFCFVLLSTKQTEVAVCPIN